MKSVVVYFVLIACTLLVSINATTFTITPQNSNDWWFQFSPSETITSLSIKCGSSSWVMQNQGWGWANSPGEPCTIGSSITLSGISNGKEFSGTGSFTNNIPITVTVSQASPSPSSGNSFTIVPQNSNEWWFQFSPSQTITSLSIKCGTLTTTVTDQGWGWGNSPSSPCSMGSSITLSGVSNGKEFSGTGTLTNAKAITVSYSATSPSPSPSPSQAPTPSPSPATTPTLSPSSMSTFTITPQSCNEWWFQFSPSQSITTLNIKCGTITTTLKDQGWGWGNSPSTPCTIGSSVTLSGISNGKQYSGIGTLTNDKAITVTLGSTSTPDPVNPSGTEKVVINLNSKKAFSYLIFGVNFADQEQLNSVPYTINRKGGNAETAFNWKRGIKNSGSDWLYISSPESVDESKLPEGTSLTKHVDITRQAKSEVMLTSTLIGYAAIDERSKKWSYSVKKYGAQQQTECTQSGNQGWCQPDAGNGVKTDGTKITNNNPADTYQKINETYTTQLIEFLNKRNTKVTYWSLDNEFDLWHESHRDIHPQPATYKEFVDLSIKYGTAIKKAASYAKTLGPASWGWCGYFFSPADNCAIGADRKANGNVAFIEYYLQQLAQYKKTSKVDVLDYLDIHYYPQAQGIYSNNDDPNTQEVRIRSVKSLYDPNYEDESWIASTADPSLKKINLIPRMKSYIAKYYPTAKLAITEYNFGGDNLMSAALAQVDALGVFAREGVDMACRWVAPEVHSLAETAYKLFLNYDGKGAKIQGQVVSATTSNVDKLGTYSFYSSTGVMYVVLINKMTTAVNAEVTIPVSKVLKGTLYQFSDSIRDLHVEATPSSTAKGVFSIPLRERSASLLVVPTSSTTTTAGVKAALSATTQEFKSQPHEVNTLSTTSTQQSSGETQKKITAAQTGWIISGSVLGGIVVIGSIVLLVAALITCFIVKSKKKQSHEYQLIKTSY
jgi:hypothetical protein